jgi:ectoine hydroxylase-related dioxygenase (phytanoyl-CoA dioxygenase family)
VFRLRSGRLKKLLSSHQLTQYEDLGILKLELPAEILEISEDFISEVNKYLNFFLGTNLIECEIQYRLAAFAQESRGEIGKLYQVVRRFPSMKRLACHEWFVDISKTLMRTELVSCCNFVAARFDFPNESKYATAPHQDFPYIQGSPDALTFWMPFMDVPFDVGAPSYVPGSHKDGPQQIVEKDIDNSSGTNSVEAKDLVKWNQFEYEKIEVQKNECLIFSTNLIHKSEPNLSNACRVTTQLRFDNLMNKTSWTKGFPEGLYLGKKLSLSYPELVASIHEE